MYDTEQEIFIVVAGGTALFLALVAGIFIFLRIYLKNGFKHRLEKIRMKEAFTKEVLESRLEMQEQTFLSISQEIHDNIGQILSLVRLNLSTIDSSNSEKNGGKISTCKELLDQAIQDLRNLSKKLNSNYLDQQSLSGIIKFQLELIDKTGVFSTSFQVSGIEKNLEPNQKLIIFRIVQEVLNNAIKHSGAESIAVSLRYLPDQIVLNIRDNGVGFNTDVLNYNKKPGAGIGTHSIKNRIAIVGGTHTIRSKAGEGTQVELSIPLTA